MTTYGIGGEGRTSHAVDPGRTVVVGERILAFPLCKRPRRLVQVWEGDYDPNDGCSWCNRVIERRNGG